MKKTKILSIVSMLLILTLLIGGCTKTNQPSVNQTPANQSTTQTGQTPAAPEKNGEAVKILVWSNNRHDSEYTLQKIAEFNEANKGKIEIEYVIQTDNYANMITMAAKSNQAPDVFSISGVTGGYELPSYAEAKIVRPITEYLDADPAFRKFTNIDNYMMEGVNSLGTEVYWFPRTLRSGNRMIYNVPLLEEAGVTPPKTVPEMIEAAKKITAAGKGEKFGSVIPGQSGAIGRMIIPIAEISGIQYYDYKNGKYDFSGYKPVLQAFKQMFDDGSMFPGCASMKVDPTRAQFSAGNVGFYGNASQEVGVLTKQFPAQMEWKAAELPSLTGEIKGALSATPFDGLAMSASCKHPDEAFAVIRWFSSEDFMVEYVENGLALSISPEIMSKVDMGKIGKLQEFLPISYEGVYPKPPAVTPQGKEWRDALWETVIPQGTDIDQTIAEMNQLYNEALDRDVKAGKVKRLRIKDFDPMKPLNGTLEYLSE
ncbi:extracellular solute-binding protein [Clostridiales bacterium COT073_COT-073]|nr:extracellular solute-binding protein [Clostridiales bacterium COT073_COT-073]